MSAQLVLPLEPRPALEREDFIVAQSNNAALAFIDAYPGWPALAAALAGPAASGKSHLVRIWTTKAGARIIQGAALDETPLGEPGPLAIEDVDAGPVNELVLFSLFERGLPLLLTGREPPAHWPVRLPDLGSRYRALLSFALGAPDDDLLAGLAVKLFQDRQVAVPDAVVAHMLRALERSPAAIRDFVARADAKALAEKKPVNLALIRGLLAENEG